MLFSHALVAMFKKYSAQPVRSVPAFVGAGVVPLAAGRVVAPVLLLLLAACQGDQVQTKAAAVWKPGARDTFYLQLQSSPAKPLLTTMAANIYDIDLFDNSALQIAELKQRGHRVVCYFSAGSSEDWRADFKRFHAADMGNKLDGWKGERWLDTRSANVRKIMLARLDVAVQKGCDGVDADNVDAYRNNTGFKLTAGSQLDFNRFLAAQAHARGLVIGLKNDVDQLAQLASSFDFAVNEQCHEYEECAAYRAFTEQGKPVLNIEYRLQYVNTRRGVPAPTPAYDRLCGLARAEKLHTQVLPLALDGSYRFVCQ